MTRRGHSKRVLTDEYTFCRHRRRLRAALALSAAAFLLYSCDTPVSPPLLEQSRVRRTICEEARRHSRNHPYLEPDEYLSRYYKYCE